MLLLFPLKNKVYHPLSDFKTRAYCSAKKYF